MHSTSQVRGSVVDGNIIAALDLSAVAPSTTQAEKPQLTMFHGLTATGRHQHTGLFPAIATGYTPGRRLALRRCRRQKPEKPTHRIHRQREALPLVGYQVCSS